MVTVCTVIQPAAGAVSVRRASIELFGGVGSVPHSLLQLCCEKRRT
jgi:hypothetical protein